ncbi:MAG: S-layer homology domain-containing protein [Clostridia bacterium]|nr:S-layer homology domain-containing protein [Clostridia bacterium]
MKIKRKVLGSILIGIIVLLYAMAPVFANSKDKVEHWAQKTIDEFYEKGYISGYSDGSFKPDNPITRAEFVTLVNRVFGFKEKANIQISDAPGQAWFGGEFAKGVAAGYVSPNKNGTIRPYDPVTRIEAAKVISILLKWQIREDQEVLKNYKDFQYIPSWGKGYLRAALENKYFQGSPDGWLQPLKPVSRAETAVLLFKAKGGEFDNGLIPETNGILELKGLLFTPCCKDNKEDSKTCLLMPDCSKDGYGVKVIQPNGTYGFFKFDQEGNKLARDILLKTKKQTNIAVSLKAVDGVLNGGNLKVISLLEDLPLNYEKTDKPSDKHADKPSGKPSDKPPVTDPARIEQEFKGWLGDSDCSPNLSDPSKMSLKCLKCPHCEKSGYGISVKQSNGTYQYYPFDAEGHKLAKESFVDKAKNDQLPELLVKGTLEGNIIHIQSISEF